MQFKIELLHPQLIVWNRFM